MQSLHPTELSELHLYDFANDAIFVVDTNGYILDVNRSGYERLGYSKQEMVGKHVSLLNSPESANAIPDRFAALEAQGKAVFETTHVRKDGTLMPCEVNSIRIEQDNKTYFISIVRDITERKKFDEIRQFQTRIYIALLYTNRALLESKTENEIYSRICQVAAKYGGVRLAWVGKIDEKTDLIIPVVKCGKAQGYLDGIRISARADIPEGQGPTAIAFRERRTIVVQDFSTDPLTQPWRKRANEYGLRASAALVIRRGGKPYAAISFYYGQTNTFDSTTIELLEEMARNIGFALDRFDLEKEREETLHSLEKSALRYQKIIQSSVDGFFTLDMQGQIQDVNQAYLERSGYNREEILNMRVSDLDAFLTQEEHKYVFQDLVRNGYINFTTKHRTKDGSNWPMQVSAVYLPEENIVMGFMHDMSEFEKAHNELQIAASVFESQEAMLVMDAERRIMRVNNAFTQITGYVPEEVVGKDPSILHSARYTQEFFHEMWETLQRTGLWEGEIWDKRKNGEIYPKQLTISAVSDNQGNVINYVETFVDLKERKEAEGQIERLAFYDQLTDLPNRRLALERLEHALITSERKGNYGAILYLDIDHFKVINDTLGHDAGDTVLLHVAKVIQNKLRLEDTVARLGGDEFVVILEDLGMDEEHAATQAKLIADKLLEDLGGLYTVSGRDFSSSVSIGISLFRGMKSNFHEILKRGDLAMYAAKKAGRNTMRFFDPVMQETLERRTLLEQDLRRALEQGQFCLYFQKRVNEEGDTNGAEVLLRWIHPQRGIISPLDFIPLCEETGLIVPIGEWILTEACAYLSTWQHQETLQHLKLSINVSAMEIKQPHFVNTVREVVKKSKINPTLLILEITESMLLENMEDFIVKMEQIRELGISFALDDFGTGYSSLSYLKKLPINELKIDKSFIQDIGIDINDEAIVETIVQMGKTLGIDILAEGVETQEQYDILRAFGCHNYQGYLFGHPTTIDDFEREFTGLIKNA